MGRDPTKQYTSKPSKKAMKTAKEAFEKQREGAQQTIKQPTATKKTTLKDKLISGGRTLAEWKHIMDIISGNVPGIIKNIGVSYGANKLLGDQAYRGGDIQPWDEDYVTGLGSFNLADMGITPDTDYTQVAKVYSTEDMMNLLGIKDQATAEKYVEDPYVGSPKFITRKKRTQPRTQAEAMAKFTENLIKQETDYPSKTFDQQRSGAMEMGIRPEDRSLIPSDFLDKPGEAATQMPFKNIAAEIEKKYPMARGGIVNLYKYGGFLG